MSLTKEKLKESQPSGVVRVSRLDSRGPRFESPLHYGSSLGDLEPVTQFQPVLPYRVVVMSWELKMGWGCRKMPWVPVGLSADNERQRMFWKGKQNWFSKLCFPLDSEYLSNSDCGKKLCQKDITLAVKQKSSVSIWRNLHDWQFYAGISFWGHLVVIIGDWVL